jgi:hypothetical protein
VGTKVLDSLTICVKVADCYDLSSADTLTFVKTIETCVETDFVTEHV